MRPGPVLALGGDEVRGRALEGGRYALPVARPQLDPAGERAREVGVRPELLVGVLAVELGLIRDVAEGALERRLDRRVGLVEARGVLQETDGADG